MGLFIAGQFRTCCTTTGARHYDILQRTIPEHGYLLGNRTIPALQTLPNLAVSGTYVPGNWALIWRIALDCHKRLSVAHVPVFVTSQLALIAFEHQAGNPRVESVVSSDSIRNDAGFQARNTNTLMLQSTKTMIFRFGLLLLLGKHQLLLVNYSDLVKL